MRLQALSSHAVYSQTDPTRLLLLHGYPGSDRDQRSTRCLFIARYVAENDVCGPFDSQTHAGEPIVEIFDASVVAVEPERPLGWMITSYRAEGVGHLFEEDGTPAADRGRLPSSVLVGGLIPGNESPAWHLPPEAVVRLSHWTRKRLAEAVSTDAAGGLDVDIPV